jgi:predicted dehydrogenase
MKALFVGLGSIGQRHLRNLKALRPNIEIHAFRSSHSSPLLSETNQVIPDEDIKNFYNIKEFNNLNDALRCKPDIVFVTNPTSFHLDVAVKALESGAHIFLEKPISHSFDGVAEFLKIEQSYKKNKVFVGYQFRYNPALILVKKLLDENKIGNIVGAQLVNGEYLPNWHPYEDYRESYASRNSLGGGALVTQIHDFDYLIWLFGMPQTVYAVGGHLSDLEIDVEDSVTVLMKVKGIPISLQLDYLQWPSKRSITITADQGSIWCDLINMEVEVNDRVSQISKRYDFPEFNRNDLFLDEMKDFLNFVSGGTNPMVSLEDGAASLKLALDAKKSMKSGSSKKVSWDGYEFKKK